MNIKLESQSFLTESSDASQDSMQFFCPERMVRDREELTCRKKKLETITNGWLRWVRRRFKDSKKKLTSLGTLTLRLWAQIFD